MSNTTASNLSILRGARPDFTTVDRLIKARQHAEISSNEELSEVTGVGRNKLGRLLSGTDKLTMKYAVLIGVACGVDPEWLLENEPTGDDAPVGTKCAPWDSNPEPADTGIIDNLRVLNPDRTFADAA